MAVACARCSRPLNTQEEETKNAKNKNADRLAVQGGPGEHGRSSSTGEGPGYAINDDVKPSRRLCKRCQ